MNTVFQGLYDKAQEIPDETDRYNFYVNYSIDYLRESRTHGNQRGRYRPDKRTGSSDRRRFRRNRRPKISKETAPRRGFSDALFQIIRRERVQNSSGFFW